jgi:hypothetical protein
MRRGEGRALGDADRLVVAMRGRRSSSAAAIKGGDDLDLSALATRIGKGRRMAGEQIRRPLAMGGRVRIGVALGANECSSDSRPERGARPTIAGGWRWRRLFALMRDHLLALMRNHLPGRRCRRTPRACGPSPSSTRSGGGLPRSHPDRRAAGWRGRPETVV